MKKPISGQKWYIFYTCPRAEKAVQQELQKRNYDVFLPVTNELRVWKNRQKKMIAQVLFPNYIFVKTYPSELYYITCIPKIVCNIGFAGKPSSISQNDVEGIREMLGTGKEITVETNFSEGEKVEILGGPLIGYEGILVEKKGRTRFGIQIKEIRHTVLIDVNINELKKI